MTHELMTGNYAAAKGAWLAAQANRSGRGFGGGAYPITPQTECIEWLCKNPVEKGHIVRVESEHSAMAVCMGFSLAGARAFTASSSNGLAYMTENVFAAAFYRLPIVMMAVNRSLGPPWNIWVDHGDTLALRDAGWVQFYCEENQEVLDLVLAAFRLAEDPKVLLPAMVCQDAFVLSHTVMRTEVPELSAVERFLPVLDLPHRLTLRPRTVGGLDFPHETEVHRAQMSGAMANVPAAYEDCRKAFREAFGRALPEPVVPYRMEDAETVLVSMGTTASTVRRAVDGARAEGIRVGALRVAMFRPFPEEPLVSLLAGKRRIGVIDRNLCPGLGGILWAELRGLAGRQTLVQGYLAGLGGGDIRPEHVRGILADLQGRTRAAPCVHWEVG